MNRQLFAYHPTIGYLFVPGIKARVEHESGGYLMRTNRAGFRCHHEFERKRRPDTFRILLFGDSFTAGDGVSDRFRYGDVLEKLIPSLEVYNFALPGSGTDQHYLIWREIAKDYEHDLVVIGVLVENIRRIVARYRPYQSADGKPIVLAKPYFSLDSAGALELHNVPVPREPVAPSDLTRAGADHIDRGGRYDWLRSWVTRLGPAMKNRVQRITRYQPLPGYDRPDNPDWLLMKSILLRWTNELERPVVLCPIPIYQYVEDTASPRGYRARFRELDSPPRVRVHDPLPDFQKVPPPERRSYRFETDPHLTPAAHEVLARSLMRVIEQMIAEARSGAGSHCE